MKNIRTYLPRLPYWNHMTQEEKEFVAQRSFLHTYPKGSMIFSYGGHCLGMILLIHGELRVSLTSEEGREITLFRLYDGEPCVFSAACVIEQITFDTQMTAEADSTLLVVSAGAFKRLTDQNIYARCFMFELATERFSTVMWSMQQILFARFDRRLAQFLLQESDRTGRTEIRMTHEQIAQQVSSAREVVARMLKRFAGDGLVTMRRGSIELCDLDGLRKLL